jgi:C4-dicarboxylate-specific signal transduction histidine kinase
LTEFCKVILVATHIATNETLQFELKGSSFKLGRATSDDPEEKLSVTFDPRLSRRTALLSIEEGAVRVERDGSRYPLFHEGEEKERFQLLPGQRFSSGETVFELLSQSAHTLTVQAMEQANRTNAEEILQVLLRLQSLLNQWREPSDLADESVGLLQELLPGAQVAFFSLNDAGEPEPLKPSSLIPSRSLVAEALTNRLPAYHVWTPSAGADEPTQFADENWALVAPIQSSTERMLLYAVGHESHNTPGDLQRSALALVAQTLSQHLEGRRALLLAARVEAEQQANRNLRILLVTIERSLSLQGERVEAAFLEGARQLTGADWAKFQKDLSNWLEDDNSRLGEDDENAYIAVAFEHYRPKGILCKNPPDEPFLPEDEGWLEALLGFAETVFENRRLHHQVRSSLDQLKESQAQLVRSSQWAAAGRLAANAAHELNTPLGAIKLAAETAQTFLKDGPQPTIDSLKLIERSVERCRKVTERLLVYSKPREEKDVEEFALDEVLGDSLSSLSPFMRSKPVEIDWEQNGCLVRGDVQDCYWAVTNVIKNAFDALSGLPERRIRLTTTAQRDNVLLLVEDSGPGVAEVVKENLFEPFVSTKKIGEGNGLGLAISRRNLRSWGGDISLQETSMGGAAFCLKIPLAIESGRGHDSR